MWAPTGHRGQLHAIHVTSCRTARAPSKFAQAGPESSIERRIQKPALKPRSRGTRPKIPISSQLHPRLKYNRNQTPPLPAFGATASQPEMETRQVFRPLSGLSSHASSSSSVTRMSAFRVPAFRIPAPAGSRRHQSTTSRTKKALKIAPHPDFLTSASGPNHIIYNPPPSVASVYHTPFKFLPKTDPRRQANLGQLLLRQSSSSSLAGGGGGMEGGRGLPPVMHKSETIAAEPKKYNVTREQVEEMRALRASDPVKWSVLKLAEKFECGPVFVMMCCKASVEHRDTERQRLEAIKARWGPVRTKARADRQKRKQMVLRGLL
ncbi:mitochondrial ribosomal protein subunit L20-domain-containing protein [Nemania sp. FL0916]|nr:mitochondrial ribosomal protein subunit L20-domain-containing protein [Nemania sp. FL0916]